MRQISRTSDIIRKNPSARRRFIAAALTSTMLVTLVLPVAAPMSATAGETVTGQVADFNIPSQEMAAALHRFADQTKTQLFYSQTIVRGRMSKAIQGKYTQTDALAALLADSGLVYEYSGPDMIVIRVAKTHSNLTSAPAEGNAPQRPNTPVVMEDDRDNTTDADISEVIVTGFRFFSQDTTGASLLPLPIEDIPQSISLVNRDFLEALHVTALDKLAEYTPGMLNGGKSALVYDNLKLRGFNIESISGYKLDGFHHDHFFDLDTAFLERVEVIRGPSSVIYGEGSPGGLVNQVLKKATSNFEGRASLQGGSWNTLRGILELGGPVSESGDTRLIGITTAERADSFINSVNHRNINQYFRIESDISDNLSLTGIFLGGKSKSVLMDGLPTKADGSFLDVPRSFFLGHPEFNHNDIDYLQFIGRASYHTSSGFDANLSVAYAHIKYSLGEVLPYFIEENGDAFLGGYEGSNTNTSRSIDLQVSQKFTLFSQEDNLILLSINNGKDNFHGLYHGWDFQGNTNIVNIYQSQDAVNAIAGTGRPDLLGDPTYNANTSRTRTVYTMQSVLKPLEKLQIISGVSITSLSDKDNLANFTTKYKTKTTFRSGVVYEMVKDWNIYSSYSESYSPQTYLDENDKLLPPSRGKQYEIGFKGFLFDRNLFLSGSAYQIDQKDLSYFVADEYNGHFEVFNGVRHKGAELEAAGNITPNLTVRGGIAYLDPRIVDDGDPSHTGARRAYQPKWTASLSSTYEIPDGPLKGLGFGGGFRYIGSAKMTLDPASASKPAYEIVDAVIYYRSQGWEARINIDNLFNKDYYLSTYESPVFGNLRGAPRGAFLTVQKEF